MAAFVQLIELVVGLATKGVIAGANRSSSTSTRTGGRPRLLGASLVLFHPFTRRNHWRHANMDRISRNEDSSRSPAQRSRARSRPKTKAAQTPVQRRRSGIRSPRADQAAQDGEPNRTEFEPGNGVEAEEE